MPDKLVQQQKDIRKAKRKILVAGVAGVLCGLFCLLLASDNLAKSSSKDFIGMEREFYRWALRDLLAALAFFSFSFGTFKKSRVCASLLLAGIVVGLVIFPISLILLVPRLEGNPLYLVAVGLPLSIPFYLGVRGAFAYRRLTRLPSLPEAAGEDGSAAT